MHSSQFFFVGISDKIYLFSMQCLGKVGTVKHINASGDILILISGQIWVFNPLCLTLAPGLTPDGGGGGGGEATGMSKKCLVNAICGQFIGCYSLVIDSNHTDT